MKFRTVLILLGLAVAARKANQVRSRPPLLLEPGPPVSLPRWPPDGDDADAEPAPDPVAAHPDVPRLADEQTAVIPLPPGLEATIVVPPVAVEPDVGSEADGPHEIDGWPVPASLDSELFDEHSAEKPVPVLPPVVEDVPTGWTVVLPGSERPPAPAPVEPGSEDTVVAPAESDREPRTDPEKPSHPSIPVEEVLLGNHVPLVFVGATPLAALGLDRVVGRWAAVSYHDCFDGRHGSITVPRGLSRRTFAATRDAVDYLLANRDVIERLRLRPGKIVALDGDDGTERLAAAFGHSVALAPADLRARLGAPAELTGLAQRAGVRALPAVTGEAGAYQELLQLARGLGTDLFVEPIDGPDASPVPIATLEDWSAHQRRFLGERLRVTRRIGGRQYTLAGVVGKAGTVVGAAVADIRHHSDLPTVGAITAADVSAATGADLRAALRELVTAVGGELSREGFAGMFEVDVAVDEADAMPTLIALRPHGAIAIALDTVASVGTGDVPLLALHVATQLGHDLGGVAARTNAGTWSLCVIEDATPGVEAIMEAPASGIWRLDPSAHGGARYVRSETDWRSVMGDEEGFFLRVARVGSLRYAGAVLGVVVVRGRLTDDAGVPTERAFRWLRGVERNLWTGPAPVGTPPPEAAHSVAGDWL